jgi:hypothetical protein
MTELERQLTKLEFHLKDSSREMITKLDYFEESNETEHDFSNTLDLKRKLTPLSHKLKTITEVDLPYFPAPPDTNRDSESPDGPSDLSIRQ